MKLNIGDKYIDLKYDHDKVSAKYKLYSIP